MATKDELREKLDELGAEQPPADALKDELEAAVAKAEFAQEQPVSEGAEERLETVEEQAGEVTAEEVAVPLDASGPLLIQAPEDRIMTGAVSEAHAAEQEKILSDLPEDFVGDVNEAGTFKPAKQGSGPNGEFLQTDVDYYPPPLPDPPATNDAGWSTAGELYPQKSVLYTDGLSGAADQNLERAYEVSEVLQSNDPETRAAGDESLSEAAKEEKSDDEAAAAEEVKNRD